jgi:hypothetical protein
MQRSITDQYLNQSVGERRSAGRLPELLLGDADLETKLETPLAAFSSCPDTIGDRWRKVGNSIDLREERLNEVVTTRQP